MARPRKPNTTQVSVRIDVTVAKRTERVIEGLLQEQPELRPFLTTLASAYRLFLERGLNDYEADLGLRPSATDTEPAKSPKTAAKKKR
jgi:hypothetical protein